MNTELKERIEKLESEAKELKALLEKEEKKQEFKAGDWVEAIRDLEDSYGGIIAAKGDVVTIKSLHSNDRFYSESKTSVMDRTMKGWGYFPLSSVRKLSDSEIESHLIEEAKKKGFVVGGKVKDRECVVFQKITGFALITSDKMGSVRTSQYYKQHGIHLAARDGDLIVPVDLLELRPSTPEIEINGYKAEFSDGHVKFGCKIIAKELFLELQNIYNRMEGIGIIMEDIKIFCEDDHFEVTREQIKTISSHYSGNGGKE